MLNPTRLYPTLNIFAKFRQGYPLWGSWIQINCAVFWQIRCYIRRIAADTTDISSLSKTLSWKFCKWMQQLHTRAAGEWTPSPVSNIFLLLKNSPCHKTFPVSIACSIGHCHWCPMFFPSWKDFLSLWEYHLKIHCFNFVYTADAWSVSDSYASC